MKALFVAAVAVVASGCVIDIDYRGTRFRCTEDPTCPDGHQCVAGFCEADDSTGDPDAGPARTGEAAPRSESSRTSCPCPRPDCRCIGPVSRSH